MLDKRIYEALPYVYLALGAVLVFSLQHPASLLLALAFFAQGARIWVHRSSYRRRQQRLVPKPVGAIPFWCYELLPFGYAGCGLVLLAYADSRWLQASAVLLLAAGAQLWWLRAIQRRVS